MVKVRKNIILYVSFIQVVISVIYHTITPCLKDTSDIISSCDSNEKFQSLFIKNQYIVTIQVFD